MNDQFLYDCRPPVRQEFKESLYGRLDDLSKETYFPMKGLHMTMRHNLALIIPVILIASLGILYSLTGDVRAEVDKVIRNIAGFFVNETAVSPISEDIQAIHISASEIPTMEAQKTMTPYWVDIPAYSVKEVIQNPPFDFSLPAYIPEGFELESDAAIALSKSWVSLGWVGDRNTEIEMLVEREYTGYSLPAGVDSAEEVEVNGQPAMLVRGGWTGDAGWQADYGMEVHWQKGGRYYRLIWHQRSPEHNQISVITTDLATVQKELIRMAESVN